MPSWRVGVARWGAGASEEALRLTPRVRQTPRRFPTAMWGSCGFPQMFLAWACEARVPILGQGAGLGNLRFLGVAFRRRPLGPGWQCVTDIPASLPRALASTSSSNNPGCGFLPTPQACCC